MNKALIDGILSFRQAKENLSKPKFVESDRREA